jgi:hypothetical protein
MPDEPENGSPPQRHRSGFADPEFWTPERRAAQAEWQRRAHAAGIFGGPGMGQGRKSRKKLASERVAEEAAELGNEMANVLKKQLRNDKNPMGQLAAITKLLETEQLVEKNRREDERELLNLTEGERGARLRAELEMLGFDLSSDADSTAVELPELPSGEDG